MSKNLALLGEIIDDIRMDPSRHFQDVWAMPAGNECGTQACIAGWAVIKTEKLKLKWLGHGSYQWLTPDGENIDDLRDFSWREYGRRALGLTWEEAAYLFNGNRTFEEIEQKYKDWCNEADASAA